MNKKANHHWQPRIPPRPPTMAQTLPWNDVSNRYIHCHENPIFTKYATRAGGKTTRLASAAHGWKRAPKSAWGSVPSKVHNCATPPDHLRNEWSFLRTCNIPTLILMCIYRKGVRKEGGFGVNPPLELDILQNFITCTKEINCFRILFACFFVDLMQIPRNKFACKFQRTL